MRNACLSGLPSDVQIPNDAREAEFLYIGTKEGAEARLVPMAGVEFQTIPAGKLRGQNPLSAIGGAFLLARGVLAARRALREWNPDALLVSGGYVAAPALIAARTLGIPAMIYLPDIVPGATVKHLSRFARKVAVTTPETLNFFPGKGVVTGYPVRAEFYELKQDEARDALGLDPEETTVVVFGGSQGARSINMTVINILPELLQRAQVIHVTGHRDVEKMQKAREQLPQELQKRYHVYAYLDEMPKALVAADLAICRAGASTLGELPAAGLPAILVPYPYAGAHQRLNAEYLARYNAAVVIEDRDLGMGLLPILTKLLDDPGRLARMKVEAQKLARPGAAARIVRELWQIMGKGGKGADH